MTHILRTIPVDKRRTLEIDLTAFSVDSVKRAAYRFSDRFSVQLNLTEKRAICTVIFDQAKSDNWIDTVVDHFRKELLDQELRQNIRDETKEVRNLILSHVFSRTGLIKDEPIQDN